MYIKQKLLHYYFHKTISNVLSGRFTHLLLFHSKSPPPPCSLSLFFRQTSLSGGSWGALTILTGLWSGRKRLNHCNNTHSTASDASFFSPLFPVSIWDAISLFPIHLFVGLLWCFCQGLCWWFDDCLSQHSIDCHLSLQDTLHKHEGYRVHCISSLLVL